MRDRIPGINTNGSAKLREGAGELAIREVSAATLQIFFGALCVSGLGKSARRCQCEGRCQRDCNPRSAREGDCSLASHLREMGLAGGSHFARTLGNDRSTIPSPSLTVTIWPLLSLPRRVNSPLGQRISTESTSVRFPRPKCRRGS